MANDIQLPSLIFLPGLINLFTGIAVLSSLCMFPLVLYFQPLNFWNIVQLKHVANMSIRNFASLGLETIFYNHSFGAMTKQFLEVCAYVIIAICARCTIFQNAWPNYHSIIHNQRTGTTDFIMQTLVYWVHSIMTFFFVMNNLENLLILHVFFLVWKGYHFGLTTIWKYFFQQYSMNNGSRNGTYWNETCCFFCSVYVCLLLFPFFSFSKEYNHMLWYDNDVFQTINIFFLNNKFSHMIGFMYATSLKTCFIADEYIVQYRLTCKLLKCVFRSIQKFYKLTTFSQFNQVKQRLMLDPMYMHGYDNDNNSFIMSAKLPSQPMGSFSPITPCSTLTFESQSIPNPFYVPLPQQHSTSSSYSANNLPQNEENQSSNGVDEHCNNNKYLFNFLTPATNFDSEITREEQQQQRQTFHSYNLRSRKINQSDNNN